MDRLSGYRRTKLLLILLALASMPLVLPAQTGTATLSGRVTDKTGAVVEAAEVGATNIATNRTFKRVTNGEGLYTIPALVPGTYNLMIRKPGFKESAIAGLILNVDGTVNQNAILQPGAANETVTVSAESQGLNTSSGTVSTVIDEHLIEKLPLNGRSFQSLIELTPGVVPTPATFSGQGQFSVNGQRADANYFSIDGVGANFGGSSAATLVSGSGNLPTVSAQGGTNSLVSVDAMQEFRVQTSTYAPEFGRNPGGQISITTRPGTNKFHGNLFEYFRNDAMDANNWFNDNFGIKKPALRQNDFGGTLGGPIFRDKTFFFFSYEGLRLRVPHTEEGDVPTVAARQAAPPEIAVLLRAFPLPNRPDPNDGTELAPFVGAFSNPASLNSYSIRIDQSLGSRLQLFGRFVNAPSSDTIRGSSSGFSANTVFPQLFSTRSLTLGLTWQVSKAIVNELRYGYGTTGNQSSTFLDTFGGAVVPPDSALFSPSVPFTSKNAEFEFGTFTGNNTTFVTGANTNDTQTQHNIIDNLSITRGTHDVKMGIDYRRLSPVFNPTNYVVAPLFLDIPSAVAESPALIIVGTIRRANIYYHNIGSFVQDNWKATPRLTLTYGLRWDIDQVPTFDDGLNILSVTGFGGDPANLALRPPGTPPYANTYGNFAPRVGINYQAHQNPGYETVVRGGYGIFYDLASSAIGNGVIANGYPFGSQKRLAGPALGGDATFPLTPDEAAPPVISLEPPLSFATLIDPHLKLPYTHQFNVAVEQALGRSQALSISYVGARGERLIQTAEGSGAVNATFNTPILYDNRGFSNYNALQVQFRRHLDTGLQVMAAYTWSHSIDSGSSSSGSGNDDTLILGEGANVNKGDSDFDLRHSASFAFTYDVPQLRGNLIKRAVLGDWSAETIALLYSAPPVTPLATSQVFMNFQGLLRPDRVPGVPVFLYGKQYPGGKRINPDAFQEAPTDPATGNPIREGTQGRNALRGFGVAQWDFAFHRDFPLKDQVRLQIRAEMFNIINHPNFGPLDFNFGSSRFGTARTTLSDSLGSGGLNGGFNPLFQIGGPRSIQLALKLNF